MAEMLVYHNRDTIKDEPVDLKDDDGSETVYDRIKDEPAEVDGEVLTSDNHCADVEENVRTQYTATVKQELDIGQTVVQPRVMHFMLGPCKAETADHTPQSNSAAQPRRSHNKAEVQHDSHSERPTSGNKEIATKNGNTCDPCGQNIHQMNNYCDVREFCTVCRKPYIHNLRHDDESPFICDVCSEDFTKQSSLGGIHETIFAGERPYSCDDGSKRLMRKGILYLKKNSGQSPYTCDVCNKCFRQKCDLSRHEIVHTGERPYSCDVCSKRFGRKGTLCDHMKKHSDERPYSCDICDKCFPLKRSLNRHKKIHAYEFPFSCDVCSKRFKRERYLNSHAKIHSEGLYSSDFCSKRFRQKGNLNAHTECLEFNFQLLRRTYPSPLEVKKCLAP